VLTRQRLPNPTLPNSTAGLGLTATWFGVWRRGVSSRGWDGERYQMSIQGGGDRGGHADPGPTVGRRRILGRIRVRPVPWCGKAGTAQRGRCGVETPRMIDGVSGTALSGLL